MERAMATSPILAVPQKQLEDPLAHLPCSSILEYRKGQVIYNQDQPSTSIYLVIDGKVKVCRTADDGRHGAAVVAAGWGAVALAGSASCRPGLMTLAIVI